MVMEPSQNKNNEHWGIDETKFFISMWRQDEILRKIQDKGTRKKKVSISHSMPGMGIMTHVRTRSTCLKNRDILGKLIIAVFRMNVDSVVAIQ